MEIQDVNVTEVTAVLADGQKVRFIMKYPDFIKMLKNDKKAGMDMWLDDDNISLNYIPYFKVVSLKYNSETGKISKVRIKANNFANDKEVKLHD